MSTSDALDEILSWPSDGFCYDPDVLDELCRVQEVFFNVGRAMQSVQLNHLAHHMYEKALQLAHDFPRLAESKLNLTREAAFNLVVLYQASRNDALALNVIRRHLSYD